MPQFTVNTHRFDPYKNFKFRVKWDGRDVAGITRVSGLRRRTGVIDARAVTRARAARAPASRPTSRSRSSEA